MTARFAIGIDLGTTNSVLAYTRLDERQPHVQVLSIPQVSAPFQTEFLPHLPSFAYIPNDVETAERAVHQFGEVCVGAFARQIAPEQPERTVAAAKSWLCHPDVNRHEPILPWQAPDEVRKMSPVDASTYYLERLVHAWNEAFPDAPIAQQHVILTVPASFDVVARELTLEAAQRAGLSAQLVLLEEPQAAIYHWIQSRGESWREQVSAGDRILVCDCGGGTTDLTLIDVREIDGELELHRRAVGNHLLIGGDNMDLALAHFVSDKFAKQGVKLNAWQAVGLWHACRNAKERLLAKDSAVAHPISVLGRGSKLIGGTVTLELAKSDAEEVLIEGFFPRCESTERPMLASESGFQELGLPFEPDTAVTKHVAAFLADHAQSPSEAAELTYPTRLMFNGGVFKSAALRSRLIEVLDSWSNNERSIQVLGGPEDLDMAVACGAAFYAWSKANGGVRVRGGTAASYYIGIETTGPAVPGFARPVQALCVAQQGMEEGTEAAIPGRTFGLVVGKPAKFRFFSSHYRPEDKPGTLLRSWDEGELVESIAIELTLPVEIDPTADPSQSVSRASSIVPVTFESKVTELGMFELWCVSVKDQQRWRLSFNARSSLAA